MTFHANRQLLEGQIGIAAVVRQARLRPERAEGYPTLPASMWTSARCLAALVTTYAGSLPPRPGTSGPERTLPETDFEFRGGPVRRPAGQSLRTRIGEPAFDC